MKNITLKGRPNFQPALPLGDCTHRWRICEPNGALSDGTCGKCGVTRAFKNGSDYYIETDFKNRYES